MLSREELLMPRYKVIADYPGCLWKLGQVITDIDDVLKRGYSKYPHLFKLLEWWEDRKPKDMPKYIKFLMRNGKYRYFHIKKYNPEEGFLILRTDKYRFPIAAFLVGTEPTTEEEYLAQKSPKA